MGGAGSGIGYDRTGWDERTGALKPLAIVYARDVEFVELELERIAHAHIEARIEDIRVKAGLEVLERESVIRTERGWRVRFRGPQGKALAARGSGVVCISGGSSPAVLGRRLYPVETAFHSLAQYLTLKFSFYFPLTKWIRAA